jgi:hypothetical protein
MRFRTEGDKLDAVLKRYFYLLWFHSLDAGLRNTYRFYVDHPKRKEGSSSSDEDAVYASLVTGEPQKGRRSGVGTWKLETAGPVLSWIPPVIIEACATFGSNWIEPFPRLPSYLIDNPSRFGAGAVGYKATLRDGWSPRDAMDAIAEEFGLEDIPEPKGPSGSKWHDLVAEVYFEMGQPATFTRAVLLEREMFDDDRADCIDTQVYGVGVCRVDRNAKTNALCQPHAAAFRTALFSTDVYLALAAWQVGADLEYIPK